MSTRSFGMSEPLHRYVNEQMLRPEPEPLRALRQEADALPQAAMRMAAEQGAFHAFLIGLIGARQVLEIGTFVGYGTLWMAQALPPDGRIVTCDIEPKFPAVGRPFWRQAGVEARIDLRLGPARDTLDALLADGAAGSFDIVFIDADKTGYPAYLEAALKLIRRGGLVLVDNVLWGGAVADPADNGVDTRAIRAVNAAIRADRANPSVVVPIGDGLTLIRRA